MERKRAREEQAAVVNKMFYQENSVVGNQQAVHYNVIAQVKKVCEVVDGFIYVANAEAHKSKVFLFTHILWKVGMSQKIYAEYRIYQHSCSDYFKINFISAVSSFLTRSKRSLV